MVRRQEDPKGSPDGVGERLRDFAHSHFGEDVPASIPDTVAHHDGSDAAEPDPNDDTEPGTGDDSAEPDLLPR